MLMMICLITTTKIVVKWGPVTWLRQHDLNDLATRNLTPIVVKDSLYLFVILSFAVADVAFLSPSLHNDDFVTKEGEKS